MDSRTFQSQHRPQAQRPAPLGPRSAEFVHQEQVAFDALLAHPSVSPGQPVTLGSDKRAVGHLMCEYHLVETLTGEDVDGGSASTLLSYLTNGTYGAGPFTLNPCVDPAP